MSDFHTPRCDRCGRLKGITNRWFKAAETLLGYLIIWRAEAEQAPIGYLMETAVDLCGQACVSAHVEQWMSEPKGV